MACMRLWVRLAVVLLLLLTALPILSQVGPASSEPVHAPVLNKADEYLVLFGREWSHRDLSLVALGICLLLAFSGWPRGVAWWRYLPEIVFRVLFLTSVLVAPVFAVVLFPAGLLAAFLPRTFWERLVAIVLGLLPILVHLGTIGAAFQMHLAPASAYRGGLDPGLLVLGSGVAFIVLMASAPHPDPPPVLSPQAPSVS
jgi:hypothetical protein